MASPKGLGLRVCGGKVRDKECVPVTRLGCQEGLPNLSLTIKEPGRIPKTRGSEDRASAAVD